MVGVSRIRCTPSAVIRNLAASVAVRRTPRLRTPGSVDCFVRVRGRVRGSVRVRVRYNQLHGYIPLGMLVVYGVSVYGVSNRFGKG